MSLAEFPLILILAGLVAYAVLGGADFGAGFWMLPGGGLTQRVRDHAHRAMGPVWEANHVWLIFVLVICWTGYPTAFASIMSTLTVPFFVAAIGIILRGSTYVLRSAAGTTRMGAAADLVFAAASILTPFMLGAAAGGIASGRVPVGNAAGDLVTSWLNPTSAMIGAIAVVTGAYLAAVYLAADARRIGDLELEEAFRRRALGTAVAAGAIALGALPVIRDDAPQLYDGLTHGGGLVCVIASAVAGLVTIGLVWARRFGLSRVTAAAAVAAIIAGWALAQRPYILPPDLTVDEAAAPHATLVVIVVAALIAAVLLLPSLSLLYGLLLGGRFEREAEPDEAGERRAIRIGRWEVRVGAAASVFIAGALLNIFCQNAWQRGVAVAALLGGIAWGFALLAVPPEAPEHEDGQRGD
jgi:cytochrome bd ubiquinol oxidase subunit II